MAFEGNLDVKDYDQLFYLTNVEVEKDLVAYFGYLNILQEIARKIEDDPIPEKLLENLFEINKKIKFFCENLK